MDILSLNGGLIVKVGQDSESGLQLFLRDSRSWVFG